MERPRNLDIKFASIAITDRAITIPMLSSIRSTITNESPSITYNIELNIPSNVSQNALNDSSASASSSSINFDLSVANMIPQITADRAPENLKCSHRKYAIETFSKLIMILRMLFFEYLNITKQIPVTTIATPTAPSTCCNITSKKP